MAAWIDGIRLDICRPHKNQQCCYNGWLMQHNLLLVYTASPDGFYLGIWDVHPGSIPDISYQSYYDINAQLEDIGLKIGADKGFSKESMIKPFPKDNSTEPLPTNVQTILSSLRITACEWPNCDVRSEFAFLNCTLKHRVYGGVSPKFYFYCCLILTNVLHLFRGSNGSLFFDTPPLISAKEYLRRGLILYEVNFQDDNNN